MSDHIRLILGEREYSLLRMPPIKAMGFGLRVGKTFAGILQPDTLKDLIAKAQSGDAVGAGASLIPAIAEIDADSLEALIKDAFSFEVYAGPSKLSDPVHFDNWFKENPGDLYPVAVWAIWEHSKDFLFGSAEGFRKLMTPTVTSGSKSPKVGK